MSRNDDLRAKLTELARDDERFVAGARRISSGGFPTPLQAVLTEIDDTVLTRDLAFQFGDMGAITLVVSGRRLLGVRAIDRLAMPAIAAQLAGQQIAGEDDPRLRALVGVLLPLDLLTEPITVTSTAQEWAGPETGTGVSAERLATRLSIEYPVRPTTPITMFKTRLGEEAIASVQRLADGEEVTEGSEDDLDGLFEQAGPFLAHARPEDGVAEMAVLGQVTGDGRCLCAAFAAEESLIWIQETASVGQSATLWREIFGADA